MQYELTTKASSGALDLSISIARHGDFQSKPGMGSRHNVYSNGQRVLVYLVAIWTRRTAGRSRGLYRTCWTLLPGPGKRMGTYYKLNNYRLWYQSLDKRILYVV